MTEDSKAMALTAHLRELRKRLVISVVATVIGFAVCYNYSTELYGVLARPLIPALPPGQDYLVFTGVVEPFFIYMKVGLAGGIIIASPVILFEIWGFVAPGLYRNEKLWFAALVVFSLVLFASGALFAYFVVFPFGFKYLLGYATEDLRPILSMGLYFSMATRLLLAFGVIFQLPLAMLVLARMGIVSAKKLLRWWRYAFVGILAISAILTPTPDVFNQLLMAGPLIILYGVGVLGAALFGKKRQTEEVVPAEEEEEEGMDDSGYGAGDEDEYEKDGEGEKE
ncbi:MAG: twin-arginine translocase subunit TatC [Deltaproteobacteria bacterium]|nr:twin-arginine translocase subunit TatC [Deltaproteobacteria bacterium]